MTHYTKRYDSAMTLAMRDEIALADVVEYMGATRFATLDREFRRYPVPLTLDHLGLLLSFAGVQGFPVESWHRSIWPGEWNGEEYLRGTESSEG